ncbi:MAG: bifunctional methylenetetrahydrofolate dehydrogenase/methenyltetrahydrofolate cyclohydrolase FolD [Verrucomicrobia bacterium]|nr:MAG: bifunctional methylenetetrahydrofolate dehydrogenase/methenyltetrahydrofolate cyclohydrolase FolD [Verrucomicrobiota bacterium]
MSARILDGKALAAEMRREIARAAAELAKQGITPGLGVLLVGDDPASRSYVKAKEKACAEAGIHSEEVRLPADASLEKILEIVRGFNRSSSVHGILVQLPLPDPAMETQVLSAIDPDKDVDGFHPVNVGRLLLGLPGFIPCTPHGIVKLLQKSGITVEGRHVVIVGRSNIVGRPLANILSSKGPLGNATVTICHTRTRNMAYFTRQAEILVAAAGRPRLITADMVSEGVVVVDVGVNRVEDPSSPRGYRLVGDVDFEEVRRKAAAISPVPGGVGPMTITMLLYNTVLAAARVNGLPDPFPG